ncbi:MAG: CPBP family intramembrane glutamic endopeptidase [Planctomycetota bacterium]
MAPQQPQNRLNIVCPPRSSAGTEHGQPHSDHIEVGPRRSIRRPGLERAFFATGLLLAITVLLNAAFAASEASEADLLPIMLSAGRIEFDHDAAIRWSAEPAGMEQIETGGHKPPSSNSSSSSSTVDGTQRETETAHSVAQVGQDQPSLLPDRQSADEGVAPGTSDDSTPATAAPALPAGSPLEESEAEAPALEAPEVNGPPAPSTGAIIWAIGMRLAGLVILFLAARWLIRHRREANSIFRRPVLSMLGGTAIFALYFIALQVPISILVSAVLPELRAPDFDATTLPPSEQIRIVAISLCVRYPIEALLFIPWLLLRRLPPLPDPATPSPPGGPTATASPALELLRPHTEARPPRSWRSSIIGGVVAMVLLWPVLSVLDWIIAIVRILIVGEPADPIAHQSLQTLADAAGSGGISVWTIAFIIGVVIGAPAIEELVYRGGVQAALRDISPRSVWPSVIASSVFFAIMHYGVVRPEGLIVLFALSIGFGIAYEWSGRLITPIVMHAVFNALNVLMVLLVF